jgi:hypothetical protein
MNHVAIILYAIFLFIALPFFNIILPMGTGQLIGRLISEGLLLSALVLLVSMLQRGEYFKVQQGNYLLLVVSMILYVLSNMLVYIPALEKMPAKAIVGVLGSAWVLSAIAGLAFLIFLIMRLVNWLMGANK